MIRLSAGCVAAACVAVPGVEEGPDPSVATHGVSGKSPACTRDPIVSCLGIGSVTHKTGGTPGTASARPRGYRCGQASLASQAWSTEVRRGRCLGA